MTLAIIFVPLLLVAYIFVGNRFGKWYAEEAEKRIAEDRLFRFTTVQKKIEEREAGYERFIMGARIVMTLFWIPLLLIETLFDEPILRMCL